jgi:isopenicillin-N N-acyltransferase-like protein
MSSSPSPMPESVASKPRGWRVWRACIALAFTLLFVGAIVLAAIDRLARIDPPPVPPDARAAAAALPLTVRGDRTYVGDDAWMGRRRGVWELHLAGDPYTLGYTHGRLGARLLVEQEEYMFGEFRKYVPSPIARTLIRAGVMLGYRNLGKLMPLDRQLELAGLAAGSVDLHGDFLPTFHRMVFYHALHDITQTLEKSPLLGCSAFAAVGGATRDGHLLVGRNFDFEGPEIFDREKVVLFFKPAGKIPFASVAWAGMTGAVTGINAEKIYVSVNAARTDDKGQVGVPVEILIREILENARSIEDVVARVRTPVLVPDLYFVADGKTGEAAVIERSPTRLAVRRLDPQQGWLALSNHARDPMFAADRRNDHLERYLTSGARLERMEELLKERAGKLDPAGVLDILRDKRGPGGAALGLGNRNALDAIIATHSVLVDASDLVLWVGVGPHASGKFVAFDLVRELGAGTRAKPATEPTGAPADLPADPIVDTQEFADYRLAQTALRSAAELRGLGRLDRALDAARVAAGAEERSPDAQLLLGDLLWQRGAKEPARAAYHRFLELHPPYLADIERVQPRLR